MKSSDPNKDLEYLTNNKMVGKQLIDNELVNLKAKKQSKLAVPVILSVMVHTGIIAFVIYNSMTAQPIKQMASIETALITSDELVLLQNQIELNKTLEQLNSDISQNNNLANGTTASTDSGNSNSVAVEISSQGQQIRKSQDTSVEVQSNTLIPQEVNPSDIVFTPSKEVQEINTEIEERNRQFAAAMQNFEQDQVANATRKFIEKEKELEKQREKELKKVQELKERARDPEEIMTENQKALEEAEALLNEIKDEKIGTPTEAVLTDGSSKLDKKINNIANRNQQSSSPKTDFKTLNSKIKSNLERPKGLPSMRVVVNIKVNKRGEVLDVVVVEPSSSEELNTACIEAVYKSSPLPIDPNDHLFYPSFNFPFTAHSVVKTS